MIRGKNGPPKQQEIMKALKNIKNGCALDPNKIYTEILDLTSYNLTQLCNGTDYSGKIPQK